MAVKKYKRPQDMYDRIVEYFERCPDFVVKYSKDGEPYKVPAPTRAGLALHLGFATTKTLYDYRKNPIFKWVMDFALTQTERINEQNLQHGNTQGAIFALKNISGWTDKQEIDQRHSVTGAATIVFGDTSIPEDEPGDADDQLDDAGDDTGGAFQ